jgi:hypothetical protein
MPGGFVLSTAGTLTPGEHQIRSRPIDIDGNVQPARDESFFASRRIFWEGNAYITRRVAIS